MHIYDREINVQPHLSLPTGHCDVLGCIRGQSLGVAGVKGCKVLGRMRGQSLGVAGVKGCKVLGRMRGKSLRVAERRRRLGKHGR